MPASARPQPSPKQPSPAQLVWNVLSALGQTTGGEALNEHIVGRHWPEAPERINQMFEAVDIIKKLFAAGLNRKDVRHDGQFSNLESTRLWTMPEVAPEILVGMPGPVGAKRAGRTVDGLITEATRIEKVAMPLRRFGEGAREVGRNTSTVAKVLRLHLSWAASHDAAVANVLVEGPNGGVRFSKSDIRSPFEFEQMAKMVRAEDVRGADGDLRRSGPAPRPHPELRRSRVRPHLSAQCRAQLTRISRGIRPRSTRETQAVIRNGCEAHGVSFDMITSTRPIMAESRAKGPAGHHTITAQSDVEIEVATPGCAETVPVHLTFPLGSEGAAARAMFPSRSLGFTGYESRTTRVAPVQHLAWR